MTQHRHAICCVSTQNYLPQLIVLYTSILKYQDIPLYLMAVDINIHEVSALTEKIYNLLPPSAAGKLHVIAPVQIYGPAIEQMRFYYDAFELSTACKAGIHSWIQKNTNIDRWLFLDCDLLCFGSLEPIFSALDNHCILLTPHICKPGGTFLNDIQILSAGVFNGGLLGVQRSTTSQAFTNWFLNILSFYSLNDPPLLPKNRLIQSTVIFTDQRWLDLVPAYFSDVYILKKRGFNLGHWNVGNDHLEWKKDSLYIAEDMITLFHLSGWNENSPHLLSKHSSLDWSKDQVWHDVHNLYKKALSPLKSMFNEGYRFNTYVDGSVIPKHHRRCYLRHLLSGAKAFENPFLIRNAIEKTLEKENHR